MMRISSTALAVRGASILGLMCGFAADGVAQAEVAATTETMNTRTLADLPYVSSGHEAQRLDLYLPASGDGAHPLIIWIHGGAWYSGSKDGIPAAAKELVARGYVVASVGYRLSQVARYPAQIEDVKAAVRWLRAHAHAYGIDPDRIGVWGESAGGHLAALLGVTGNIRDFDAGEHLDQSSAVQCVVDWYGPANLLDWGVPESPSTESPESGIYRLLGGPVSQNREAARRASPVHLVNGRSAPFLLIHGDQDPVVPLAQSRMLHEALLQAGVESELLTITGAAHGGPEFHTTENIGPIITFFDRHLRDTCPERPAR